VNPTDIDFDLINPEVITRPEKCLVCDADPDLYFGRLNFRQPGAEFPVQYCPMHKGALADPENTLTLEQTRLVPC
jgi:hypothetical protein